MTTLGVKHGAVVYGQDKLDEISMSAPTTVCEFQNGWYKTYPITPEQFGFERCSKEELRGGTPAENAQITTDILAGKIRGPKRSTVLMNAGMALYVAGKAADLDSGIKLAADLIDSGAALKTMQAFVERSNRQAG